MPRDARKALRKPKSKYIYRRVASQDHPSFYCGCMRWSPLHQTVVLCLAAAITVFLCGMAVAQMLLALRLSKARAFVLAPDVRPQVCTVTVDGIVDGAVRGTLTGSGRVFIGAVQALPGRDGAFAVDGKAFLTQRITVTVPPGTRFVASKKGSKYYALTSAQGQKIAPANRVYFATEAEAEMKGYRK